MLSLCRFDPIPKKGRITDDKPSPGIVTKEDEDERNRLATLLGEIFDLCIINIEWNTFVRLPLRHT